MPDAPLEQLDAISGRSGEVRVTLTGQSYRTTTKGRRYPYGEFGQEFIGALHEALVGPRRRGLLRSTLVCPACERPLDEGSVSPVTVTPDLQLRNIPVIHVEVEMPGRVCPGCARRLVNIHDRNFESELSDALIDAFNQAGIAPG